MEGEAERAATATDDEDDEDAAAAVVDDSDALTALSNVVSERPRRC